KYVVCARTSAAPPVTDRPGQRNRRCVMKVRVPLARFSLLTIIVVAVGIATVLFTRAHFSALAPRETYNGQIAGSVTNVVTTRAFTVTASGILSNNISTYAQQTTTDAGR